MAVQLQRTWLTAAALLACCAVLVSAHCPNFCSGHGECTGQNKCSCWDHWMGGDCSLRRCPFGVAWADTATGDDAGHQLLECSNRGTCNHNTGLCNCMEGYEGVACSRMTCPRDCGAHGTCRSMAFHAAHKDPGTGPIYTYTNVWDSHLIHGCECDEGWTGYDCTERLCATGDDSLTTGQDNEVQVFRCLLSSGDFYLTYKRLTTEAIPFDATAAQIETALEKLETMSDIRVSFFSGTSACDSSDGNAVSIEFLQEFGDLQNILAHDEPTDVRSGTEFSTADFEWKYDGECFSISATPVCSYVGTKENDPCSGRGECNIETGVCECYMGYTTGDGLLSVGSRADCGYAQDPITECPGVNRVSCSGHGFCSDFPAYKCTCQQGWMGGDCSLRTCPLSRAWFGLPSDTDTAHTELVECGNKGVCDRSRGECVCQDLFEGEACERMTCPGTPVCSGHGQCLTMQGLAELREINGDLEPTSYGLIPNNPHTWDFKQVYGCHCDLGWEGYDCSEFTCPFGDDVTTNPENGVDQLAEEQSFTCLGTPSSSETFQITFRQFTTAPIASDATRAEVAAALEAIDSVYAVEVDFFETVTTACDDPANVISVIFLSPSGDVPKMTVTTPSGSALTMGTVIEQTVGNTEYDECSGRGLCNHNDGTCQCFTGFGSSNGRGEVGGRDDCGYRLPYFPVPKNMPSW